MSKAAEIKIEKALKHAKKNGMYFKELMAICVFQPNEQHKLREALRSLEKDEVIIDTGAKIYHRDYMDLQPATVVRVNRTFGFVKPAEGPDIFIPGRMLKGALPGDSVLISSIPPRDPDRPEGEIVRITKECSGKFTGTLKFDKTESKDGYYIDPDMPLRYNIPLSKQAIGGAHEGDKVLFVITERGERHSDHKFRVVSVYGSSENAVASAEAVLDLNGISMEFPKAVIAEAQALSKAPLSAHETAARLDLRDENIFTVDGADTKDIDDAISIKKLGGYYELSVHIADVSYYVRPGSQLDNEAFARGTSIYFADRVIPMLPKELSNGICSLNPNEDRFAFSCIMTIDGGGKLIDFSFKKSIIRSRVQGVYREVNAILAGEATDELNRKYHRVLTEIPLMKELADILTKNKLSRGAPEIDTAESYIVLDEHSTPIDIVPRVRGAAEIMIEEFMLMANEAAATAARIKEIPFIYRVHEQPSAEKIERLSQVMSALGFNTTEIKPDMKALVLSNILKSSKGLPSSPAINSIVLRSMSKAKYYEEPLGHYGLALENYAQFTSPIRRYPDLSIHRILSDLVTNVPLTKIRKTYEKFVVKSAKQSTETELTAMRLERMCDDCYKAEYMKSRIGDDFDGIISGLAPHGIYVELENTVEGLLRTENMPEGEYEFDELIQYTEKLSGKTYRIGDKIHVKCISVNVAAGKIDFSCIE